MSRVLSGQEAVTFGQEMQWSLIDFSMKKQNFLNSLPRAPPANDSVLQKQDGPQRDEGTCPRLLEHGRANTGTQSSSPKAHNLDP